MLIRLAPLVPLALVLFLSACASHGPTSPSSEPQVEDSAPLGATFGALGDQTALADTPEEETPEWRDFANGKPYALPAFADSILAHGLSLVGTRYRFGGTSVTSGFDCSGFIGYLFKEEAGMKLPRSSRDMLNIDAPKVARTDLKPGDLLFFGTNGRGRVSHAGIYLGDDQFIHSSSSRSGGVRIDSLGDRYWSRTFMQAKRALAMAPSQAKALPR
ncbi:MAG: C40 family peptidase [Pseudomonadota bacterium]